MKNYKVIFIFGIIIIYFIVMGVKNVNLEKSNVKKILNKVTIVDDGKINAKNDGKLVLVTGKVTYDGKISFLEVDYEFDTFKVDRIVQDYKKKTDSNKEVSYDWVDRDNKDINTNTTNYLATILPEQKTLATKIGEFKLDDFGMSKIKVNKYLIDKNIKIDNLEISGFHYTLLEHEDDPQVGDMRIGYRYYKIPKDGYISVLAKQKGDSFMPYKLAKDDVYRIYDGKVANKKTLEKKLGQDTKGVIRGKVLFIIVIVGILLILVSDKAVKTNPVKE